MRDGFSSGYQRPGDALSSAPDRADRDAALAARFGGSRGGASSGGGDFAGSNYPPREDVPLPTRAPFTAFVGNLAFDVTEGDLEEFFQPLAISSIRLVNGPDGRPKGFGYVEFKELDALKGALERHGAQFGGRSVRISVAEPRE